jgi:LmbE family N-acetylglucosaminyl deacetylase
LIIPKTLEPTWLDALAELPHFVPGSADLVIISPHPDDETLGAGALIASHCGRGGRATIIAVTDGENAYENFPGLAAIRIREQEEAVQKLGGANAKLVRLNLTDSGVSDREEELTEALSGCINDAIHVIAPWNGDFHPDHEAC